MGMNTYIRGFMPPDSQWDTMTAAYHACDEAGISIPIELQLYFGHEPPDDRGQDIDITMATTRWEVGEKQSIEIEIAKLPHKITHIRFTTVCEI